MMNQAITHFAAVKAADDIIIAQVHDAIVVETSDPERVVGLLKRCMEQTHTVGGNEMTFVVEAVWGPGWGDLCHKA